MAQQAAKILKDTEASIRLVDTAITKLDNDTLKYEASLTKLLGTLQKQQGTYKSLSDTQKKAKDATKQLSDEEKKINAIEKRLKQNTDQVVKAKILAAQKTKEQKDRITQLIAEENKELGTEQKLLLANAKLRKERKTLNWETKEGRKRLKEINKEIDKNTEKISKGSDKYKQGHMVVGQYTQGIMNVGKQFMALLANPVVAFLAAVAGAFMLLKNALTRSEKGQDAMNKIMKVGGAILDKLMDVVTELAETIVSAFENPKKAIADLWNAIKQNFIVRIKSAMKFVSAFGDILKGVWDLDTDEIAAGAEKAGNAYVDMITGVEDTIGKTKKAFSDFSEQVGNSIDDAKKLADMEAAYNKESRKILIENAKLKGEAAKQYKIAEELKRSEADKSIEAYNKAFDIEEQILANELKLLRDKETMAVTEGKIAKNDIEMNNKIAEAHAAVVEKEAQFDETRRQRIRRLNMVRMESFRQEQNRLKTQLNNEKILSKAVVDNNKIIINSENRTLQERIEAAQNTKDIQVSFINESFEIAKASLDKELELKLKSQADYDTELKALKLKQQNDLTANEQTYLSNITTSYAVESKKRLHDVEASSQAELTILKAKYVSGQITEQEFADQSEAINQKKNEDILKSNIDFLQNELDTANLTKEEKLKIQQIIADKTKELQNIELDNEISNAEKKKAIAEDVKQKKIEIAQAGVNAIFDIYKSSLDRQMQELDAQKAYELSLVKDNKEEQDKINKKYAKKEAEIKHKQDVANKLQSMFNIAVSTAVAVASANPIVPLMIAAAALGAIQLAVVAAKPLPKYAKGTKSAPKGHIMLAEEGMELAQKRTGELALYSQPTITDELEGARIFTNEETKRILSGKDSIEGTGKYSELIKSNNEIVKKLSNQPIYHFETSKSRITERRGRYAKTYINVKLRSWHQE